MFMEGKLCELWPLLENDYEADCFTSAVNSGLTTRHMLTGSYPMRHIDIMRVWEDERKTGDVHFGIRNASEKFIGTCGLHGHRDIYRLWEARILIFDPDAIGHGIGTEAMSMLVDYGFNRLNAHRIWLGVNEDNVGAIKCYEKVGFKEEGRLRKELFCFGEYRDAIRMGILEDEWRKLKTSR